MSIILNNPIYIFYFLFIYSSVPAGADSIQYIGRKNFYDNNMPVKILQIVLSAQCSFIYIISGNKYL